jgi:hypothetical protein
MSYIAVHHKEIVMQNEWMENWSKLTQCVSKPVMEMTELNINTMSHFAKNTAVLEALAQAKKPEELMAVQVKLAHLASLAMTNYTQRAMEIGLSAIAQTNKACVDTANKTAGKTSEFVNKTANKTADFVKAGTTKKRKS